MADDSQRPIIVRRKKKIQPSGHGGAWKIAYADFVTAMMAFFLLMWLLGSSTKGDLQGIADFFRTPLKVALAGGSGAGDANSVVQGGGKDLAAKAGQVRKAETPSLNIKVADLEAAKKKLEQQEAQRLRELKANLDGLIESTPTLKQYQRQMRIDITGEGLRVQILDEQNRPMFASGRATLQSYSSEILREIAKALNAVDNRVALSGHTDATPYAGGDKGYSNWELSADRANASRRELVAGGLNEGKVLRVVGLASSVPFDSNDPFSPANRRISIVVLNKKAEEAILKEIPQVNVDSRNDAGPDRIGIAPPIRP